jgi:thiol-disulfide isomerase/thioredoxin
MSVNAIGIGLLAAQLALGGIAAQQSQELSAAKATASDEAERRDLIVAMQQSAGSRIDYIRALEQHLKRYPNSPYREKIVRSLFQASKDLGDQRRIALYGEQILTKDSDDLAVLASVGTALNSFEENAAAQRALELGRRLEKEMHSRAAAQAAKWETSSMSTQQRLEQAHTQGLALLIQADARGVQGRTSDAIGLAEQAFAAFPSAEAARSLGRWQALAGHHEAAVRAYADAFALEDSAGHHADDRRRLTELYLQGHKNIRGLGDVVLAEYDRITALQEKLDPQSVSSEVGEISTAALLDLTGKKLPLDSLKGKVVVMDFWATWCRPCRVQHPLFEQVKQSFKDDSRVVFLEVASGEDSDTVAPFLQRQSWSTDVYLDDGLARKLNIDSIPTTLLLSPDTQIYSEMVGFRPETFVTLLTSRIQSALADRDARPPASRR